MRKFTLLVAGVALAAGTLTACIGGPPPPPPTEPHDVLVVGDSVAFSFGCVLGASVPGVPAGGCPARPGYTAKNSSVGACTIYGATVSLYNGGQAGVPNCDTVPSPPDNRTWAQSADFHVPKVVVINTGGWEIVDRWLSFTAVPDSQWGGSTSGQAYSNAAVYYSSALYNAINEFRARGAKVLVANQPHANPLQPVPPPNEVPPGLGCSWWEPFASSPPTAQGQAGSPLTCPGQWQSPTGNTSYRSSKAKFDQFNAIVTQVKNQWFGGDPNVVLFNFKTHFNQPGTDAYTSHVCPPPQDSTTAAVEDLNWNTGNLTDTAFVCNNGNGPNTAVNPWPVAILARAPDNGHLTVAGQEDILQPYLEPCVQSLLGIGGNQSACT